MCLRAEWMNVCGMENDEQKAPGARICLGGWDQGRLHKGSALVSLGWRRKQG